VKPSIALLVVSDRANRGLRQDGCETAIRAFLERNGHALAEVAVAPDETASVQATLVRWADEKRYHLALTAGGTGVSPRDITPEATSPLLDRELPGVPEAMRAASMKITPYAALSRGVAGLRGDCMIVNLPGSPKAAVENLETVFRALLHAIEKAHGDMSDCVPPSA